MAPATRDAQAVYFIDASIYIFQAHFSPYVECLDRRNEDLSALFGFTQFLLQFLRRVRPAHLAVAHDESLFCGFRHDLCADYKSNRELPDDNLARQLKACVEICSILGLPAYVSRQYEADDIIGVLSGKVRRGKAARTVQIVSRDKDLAQLLTAAGDTLWDYQANRRRTREDIYAELGIYPEQLPDYLGLVGDTVDCIRGVPGVGPVKARQLLQSFSSLEGIYDNLDRISSLPLRGAAKLAEKLREHRQLAELSKLLATIVREANGSEEPFATASLQGLRRRDPDVAGLRAFLKEYRFTDADTTHILRTAERQQESV